MQSYYLNVKALAFRYHHYQYHARFIGIHEEKKEIVDMKTNAKQFGRSCQTEDELFTNKHKKKHIKNLNQSQVFDSILIRIELEIL